MKKSLVLIIIMLFSLGACYNTSFTNYQAKPSAEKITQKQFFGLWGLIPYQGSKNLNKLCSNGVYKVTTKKGFLDIATDMVLIFLTAGIANIVFTMNSSEVICSQ